MGNAKEVSRPNRGAALGTVIVIAAAILYATACLTTTPPMESVPEPRPAPAPAVQR
jgi:hypothetical protein